MPTEITTVKNFVNILTDTSGCVCVCVCVCVCTQASLVAQLVKESACNAGDPGSIPGFGRSSAGGHGNPFQYSYLENPHGQRSLVGYSPWDCKESDMMSD